MREITYRGPSMKLLMTLSLLISFSSFAAEKSPACESLLNTVMEDTKKVYDLDEKIQKADVDTKIELNAVHQKYILQQMHSQANYETSCLEFSFESEEE